jgi:hypothetical protein
MILDDVVLLADHINRVTPAKSDGIRRAYRNILEELDYPTSELFNEVKDAVKQGLEILDGGNAGRPKP